MLVFRKAGITLLIITVLFTGCTPSLPASLTNTPHPNARSPANAAETKTPAPAVSSLNVEKETLRGVQVDVWHPWFGAEASLFESQVAQFNTENEWGIVVSEEGKTNYSELFLQTDDAIEA